GLITPVIFAYRVGSGLVALVTRMRKAAPAEQRMALHRAGRRTFTVRGDHGQPLAGVRLAPLTVLPIPSNYFAAILPDPLVKQLEVETGPDGQASLVCLEPSTELLDVHVSIPGLGTYALALPREQSRTTVVTLDLKPAGRISGRVVLADGKPVVGAEVEVWSLRQGSYRVFPVRFEGGPVRTGPDGSFRAPAALLPGARYRALIRAQGFRPILTGWITPEGKANAVANLPDTVLKPPASLSGRVVDRQRRPVAGAEVLAAGQAISALSDSQGEFRLDGLEAGPTLLVVRRDGFRIHGRLLDPDVHSVGVVLARFDELSRPMVTLSSPVPLDERLKLARRVLDPFLVKVLAKGEDPPKYWALRSLMVFDPTAALEALEKTTFARSDSYQSDLRWELARRLARDELEEAAAVAQTVPQAFRRAEALVDVCLKVPAQQQAKRKELIDQVLLAARAETEPRLKVWQLGEAAELLLDIGEIDRARAVFAEGRPIAKQLGPDAIEFVGYFASRLARVDLAAGLELLGGMDQAMTHVRQIGNLAARIAASKPAEAEQILSKIRGLSGSHGATLRACQQMAPVDLPRARQIALNQESVGFRAGALIFTAYGLPGSERKAARDLIRQAMGELDRSGEQPDVHRSYIAA
ncbi:MAG: carboxypeptidase-like regulatory domain-containing protein, partial [Isosphaeraceae bacterium]